MNRQADTETDIEAKTGTHRERKRKGDLERD